MFMFIVILYTFEENAQVVCQHCLHSDGSLTTDSENELFNEKLYMAKGNEKLCFEISAVVFTVS